MNIEYNDLTGRYELLSGAGSLIADYGRRSDAVRGMQRRIERNEV